MDVEIPKIVVLTAPNDATGFAGLGFIDVYSL